ncbi:MAG: NAD(+) synthase [Bradymonadia bacterium]
MKSGFVRIAAGIPTTRVGDPQENAAAIAALWALSDKEDAAVVVFPELALSGYTARDLFQQETLLDACKSALLWLRDLSRERKSLAIIGLPLRLHDGIYNCAVALQAGSILGVVPKSYLPNYGEFEETRWFRPGHEIKPGTTIDIGGHNTPMGTDILFSSTQTPDFVVGIEICEDAWVHRPPASDQISAGATVICNVSASNFVVGKAETRRLLMRAQSQRGHCAYLYVAAGPGESSTDLAFDADAFICENGSILIESTRFERDSQLINAEIDLHRLTHSRRRRNTFSDCSKQQDRVFRIIQFHSGEVQELSRHFPAHPFLPAQSQTLARRCWEVFEIQSNALATRMLAIGSPKLVLGISGGLDSTHAALVSAQALRLTGQPAKDLVCITMPGLGTTSGTKQNALELAKALESTIHSIDVSELSRVVLTLIHHPSASNCTDVESLIETLRQHPEWADVTVENIQARLRTLVLMSVANQVGGLVVGTGDLSEKALGWATYAGDQIAMYDVNAGVPKTLIQFVIKWVANERASTWSQTHHETLRLTLFSIIDTPISPELLPSDGKGQIAQLTESTIGPYELHDFFLYHLIGDGRKPSQTLELAQGAFGGRYTAKELKHWCTVFVKRFFQNQFKRSCTADAPKVLDVALSPRGDWRMPSDASAAPFLADIATWRVNE